MNNLLRFLAFLLLFVPSFMPLTHPGDLHAADLPECVLDFEGGCPSATAICGATFSGGQGCEATTGPGSACNAPTGMAYHLIGTFEDGVSHNDAATIEFAGDVHAVRMAFYSSTSQGFMDFFDEHGAEVGATVQSLHCRGGVTPSVMLLQFAQAVRRIEVTTTGATADVWIDELHVNPSDIVPTEIVSWSAVKARF